MTRTIDALHRADHPDNAGSALIEPLYRLFDERNSAAATEPDSGNAGALAPLAAIGLVALLMLWAVINPML